MKKLIKIKTILLFSAIVLNFIGYGQLQPNDFCATATALTVNASCINNTFTMPSSFTNSGGNPATCNGANQDDGWYSFVATATSTTITASATQDIIIHLYSACGTLLTCSDATVAGGIETITYATTIGTIYRIRIQRYNSSAGITGGNICIYSLLAPTNDLCANATNLPCGTTNLAGTTVGTTNKTHGTGCTMSGYGVWYTFVGDGQSTTISSTAVFDHEMSISSGSCGSLTSITCEDLALSGGTETYTFTSTLGTTYYVYIAYYGATGTSANTGTFTISRTCAAPCNPYTSVTILANGNTADFNFNAGTLMTLTVNNTGTANCAGNIEYLFRYSTDGGTTWTIIQNWSTSATCTHTPTVDTRYQVRERCSSCTGTVIFDNINVTLNIVAPTNDLCANATSLPCGTTNLAGTTVGTVSESAPSGCASNYGVWYTFTGDGVSTTISSTATFDHEMEIMSGTCGSLTNINCIDNELSGTAETYTFTSVIGTTYYIYIGHYSTSSTTTGTFTISRSCALPPTCTDGIMNGTETGVDCGGTCPDVCVGCTWNLCLEDDYGDGWDGSYIDVIVNGSSTGYAELLTGYGPFCYSLNLNAGDIVDLDFVSIGWYDDECAYYLYDHDGILYHSDSYYPADYSFTADCTTLPASCSDGIMNNDETGIDCGGASCLPCNEASATCEGANPFCSDLTYNFPTSVDAGDAVVGPDYGCLGSEPNPVWYYLQMSTSGNIVIEIASSCGDVDYAAWGPFSSLTCLNSDLTTSGVFEYEYYGTMTTWEVDAFLLPSGNMIDCSYDIDAIEYLTIPAAVAGEFYMVMICNYANCDGNYTFSKTSGSATTNCGIVLPIELKSFEILCFENYNKVAWSTFSEINTKTFFIEKSYDAINYEKIGIVNASGNSNSIKEYEYIDNNKNNGTTIYYKLIENDIDGFSKEILVRPAICNKSNKITINPNPVSDILNINFAESIPTVRVIINSILGNTMIDRTMNIENTQLSINLLNLVNGIYTISIFDEKDNQILIEKVIINRK